MAIRLPKFIKAFATAEANKNTLAGPDNSRQGVLYNIYDVVQQGINDGEIDVTGPGLGAVVTVDGTQTITGAKTLSATTTVSGALVASNATVTLSGVPTYADNAAALAGGLTAGRLYKTAAGALNVVVPA